MKNAHTYKSWTWSLLHSSFFIFRSSFFIPLFCLLGVSVSLWLALSSFADWPLFRGNPLQTGIATAELPDKLVVRWKFATKVGIEGTAAIVGNTVYAGSLDEHLYALDLNTGAVKWKLKLGPIKAPVSVRRGAVYVGDEDGMFYCVDAKAGTLRWKYETGGDISSGANFEGDHVLFGSGDQHLYCLSEEGKLQWKFKVPGGPVMGTPVVAQGRTFAAGCDSTLHVIETAKGKEIASVELGGQVAASAAVVGDHFYVGTMTNQVLAVDLKKNAIAWTYEVEEGAQPFYSSAAVTDQLVIIGGRDRQVHALDRKTGKKVWTRETGKKVDSSPVVVGRRVHVGSLDGNLYVLDLAKGTIVQKVALGRGIVASPAVAGGCLVIGTTDGVLYCLGAKK
jgi:outer membrane protein assembly factor BamB